MTAAARISRRRWLAIGFAAFLVSLYVARLDSDSIAGLFGIYIGDEGAFLLAAKNQVMFGMAHFFPGDGWRPELLVPLAHHYALLAITPERPVEWLYLGVASQVLGAMGLLSWLAGKTHRSAAAAAACFLCLSLNPILFFYARSALSEGMQFLILALILALIFRIHAAGKRGEACVLASAAGALTACLFLAKIGAIGACVGASAGLAAALAMNPRLPDKRLPFLLYALCGLAVLVLYLGPVLGEDLPDWWYMNVQQHASPQVPSGAGAALEIFLYKMPYLAYYLTLMPIFALYLFSLPLAADRKKGFVFVLFVVTVVTMACELALSGGGNSVGSIRRNFFSLSMLSILSGFVCMDYLRQGVSFSLRESRFKIAAVAAMTVYFVGPALLLRWAAAQADRAYIVFCLVFLLMAAIALIVALSPRHARARAMLASLAVLASLAPMLFQAFLAPRTREEINAAVEAAVPADATVIGSIAPWYLQGVRRKLIFNNCLDGVTEIRYANDFHQLPPFRPLYFMNALPIEEDQCAPKDAADYRFVTKFRLFIPENYGGLYGVSDNWGYSRIFYLYEKR